MSRRKEWNAALEDVLRGLTGGLVFGVPLLYTMEVWRLGGTAQPWRSLVALVVTFVPVVLLVATSGFRRAPDLTRLDVAIDVVTVLGVALVSVAAVLVLLRRITLGTPPPTMAQMIVFEAAPFAIGAAVASDVLGGASGERQHQSQTTEQGRSRQGREGGAGGTVSDLGAAAVGALFIGLAIAPTDEVPMLAAAIDPPWLAVLIVASLVVTYAIVFAAGFSDEERRRKQTGVLQRPMSETAVAYLVSLAISAAMLWFFGNLGAGEPAEALSHAVVLSFPASIGGAAGRLVV